MTAIRVSDPFPLQVQAAPDAVSATVEIGGTPGPPGPASTVPGPAGPAGAAGAAGAQGLPGVNAVDNDTAVAGYITTTGTSSTKTALEGKFVKKGDPLFNVKDYGAIGNGVAADTAAIQAAITACGAAGGGTVYFPKGTYLVSAASGGILLGVSNTVYQGEGAAVSVLKVDSASAAGRVLQLSSRANCTVRDLGFDGSSNATTKSGIYASTSGFQLNLLVQRCRFVDFMPGSATTTAGAVYTWTSDGVHVDASEFVGCGRAINIDEPRGHVNITRNRITAPVVTATWTGVMATGIRVSKATTNTTGKVLIQGNYVSGARYDPSQFGAEGHGINSYRTRDVQIIGNHCENSGRGILVSHECFGAVVSGNTCAYNNDSGIRVEPMITGQVTNIGTDVPRGLIVSNNVCHDNMPLGTPSLGGNYGIGVEISYAAGSVVSGNIAYNNGSAGIHVDSDRVSIVGNVSHSNARSNVVGALDDSGVARTTNDSTLLRFSGIYHNAGVGCTIIGNQVFDNGSDKGQTWGLVLNNGGNHLVSNNNLVGNRVADINIPGNIRQGFFGTPAVAKPAATADATDLASAISLVNTLKADLQALGLKA